MKPMNRHKAEAQAKFKQWRDRRIDRQTAASDDLTRAIARGVCIHPSQLTGEVQ